MRAIIRYMPVEGSPAPGDICKHPRYGIGILRAVNPHMGTFRWDAMWTYDSSFPRTLKDEISFDLSERDTVLVKLDVFACHVPEDFDEDFDEEEREWVVIGKLLQHKSKRISYNKIVDGETVDGGFRIRCKCCEQLT